MSKAQDIAARAAAVAAPTVPVAEPKAAPVRTAPVKMTVELDPAYYTFVRNWPDAVGLPAQVGKARVPTVEVFRALLQELETDGELATRVARRVRANLEG
jgi:hypothetical protein